MASWPISIYSMDWEMGEWSWIFFIATSNSNLSSLYALRAHLERFFTRRAIYWIRFNSRFSCLISKYLCWKGYSTASWHCRHWTFRTFCPFGGSFNGSRNELCKMSIKNMAQQCVMWLHDSHFLKMRPVRPNIKKSRFRRVFKNNE